MHAFRKTKFGVTNNKIQGLDLNLERERRLLNLCKIKIGHVKSATQLLKVDRGTEAIIFFTFLAAKKMDKGMTGYPT